MRTLYHLIGGLLFGLLFPYSLQAQLPNHDFESWTYDQYYEEPTGYQSSAVQTYWATQAANVKKVAGYQGFGVRLETAIVPDGTLQGALYLGGPGGQGLSGGYPYTDMPDSLVFRARYHTSPGDTALIGLIFSQAGIPFAFHVFSVAGTQNNFVRHSFPLQPFIFTPDSVILIVFSSQPDHEPDVDTWIELDEFQLINATQQLPNASMEDWTSFGSEEPDEWFSSNVFNISQGQAPMVTRTTEAYEGDYAVRIETFEISMNGQDTSLFGFILLNGRIGEGGPGGGIPYPLSTLMPRLGGYFKYDPVGSDSALVLLQFRKYNTLTQQTDTVADFTFLLPPKAIYSPFQFTMELPEMPDTVLIGFAASNLMNQGSPNPAAGSVVILDRVTFGDPVQSIDLLVEAKIRLFPNPAKETVILDTGGQALEWVKVFDGKGQFLPVRLDGRELDVSALAPGWYLVQIRTREGAFWRKMVIY